jgi:hypothetical protein
LPRTENPTCWPSSTVTSGRPAQSSITRERVASRLSASVGISAKVIVGRHGAAGVNELLPVWRGLDAWRAEAASVAPIGTRLLANGNQLGVEPMPYRLVYDLRTGEDWVTEELRVKAWGAGWDREIIVARAPEGGWSVDMAERGVGAPAWREPALDGLADALDCDLGSSPLFNSLPVLRHDMQEGGEAVDFVMAWISVPDLEVRRSEQRYTPHGGGRVNYASGDFSADIHFDDHGLVRLYEGFLERVV